MKVILYNYLAAVYKTVLLQTNEYIYKKYVCAKQYYV